MDWFQRQGIDISISLDYYFLNDKSLWFESYFLCNIKNILFFWEQNSVHFAIYIVSRFKFWNKKRIRQKAEQLASTRICYCVFWMILAQHQLKQNCNICSALILRNSRLRQQPTFGWISTHVLFFSTETKSDITEANYQNSVNKVGTKTHTINQFGDEFRFKKKNFLSVHGQKYQTKIFKPYFELLRLIYTLSSITCDLYLGRFFTVVHSKI